MIYADILISWFLAAVLEIYTQHFTRRLHFTQQCCKYQGAENSAEETGKKMNEVLEGIKVGQKERQCWQYQGAENLAA